jgi:hypothetical protein
MRLYIMIIITSTYMKSEKYLNLIWSIILKYKMFSRTNTSTKIADFTINYPFVLLKHLFIFSRYTRLSTFQ